MGFKTQRQYITSINDYEKVKEIIIGNKEQVIIKSDTNPEKGDRGNFTFYLKKYPKVRIQLTSKRYLLKLHGVKYREFLLDLKVIQKFTSLLSELYPNGIDFKLDKTTYGYFDKDRIIQEKYEIIKFLNEALYCLLFDRSDDHKQFELYIEKIWEDIRNDVCVHNAFAETGNNFYAKVLCESGFRCKPDGFLKFNANKPDPFLMRSTKILLKSGFLPSSKINGKI